MPNVAAAVDLWDLLVDGEMVRPRDYDSDLVDELRTRLRISDGVEFRRALVDDSISAEDLVRSILTVIAPVSAMMVDLLALYENIAARRTRDENIRLSFNFDADAEPLDIDLKAFREFEHRFRQATRPRAFFRWNQEPAWQMVRALEGLLPAQVSLGTFAHDEWPDPYVESPESGMSALDEALAPIWELRRGFLSEAMLLWPDRTEYRDGFSFHDDGRDPDVLTEVWGDESGAVREQLAVMVSDYWDRSMAVAITAIADRARTYPPSALSIASVVAQLDELVASIPAVHREVEHQVDDLQELLSLPVWGKRHEVYSAWVFTQIVAAIGFNHVNFHVYDGRLSFDFSGAHLASFDTVNGLIHVWTELRTRYDGPVGKGRTAAIQPDFSLTYDPVHEPATTLLAVECKQYKRSALRPHADALIDYTGGLPQASVVLAAYGPVSARVLTSPGLAGLARAAVVSHMRPGNSAALRNFHDVVSRAIPDLFSPVADSRPSSRADADKTTERATAVTLEWQAPIDLDLYAYPMDGSGPVFYGNRRVTLADGYIELDHDALAGPASETITIATAQRIHLWIHAFPDGTSPADADARVRITSGSAEIVIPIGKSRDSVGADQWFDVCVIHDHQVEVIGRISPHGP